MVLLRPLAVEDAADYVACLDDEVYRWLMPGHEAMTVDGARDWIAGARECWTERRHRRVFGIWEVASEELVGSIEAHTNAEIVEGIVDGEANIGIGIGPHGRGRGLGVRAVQLVCRYLDERGDVTRAVVRTSPDNVAACRSAERAGFTRFSVDGDALARFERTLGPVTGQ